MIRTMDRNHPPRAAPPAFLALTFSIYILRSTQQAPIPIPIPIHRVSTISCTCTSIVVSKTHRIPSAGFQPPIHFLVYT
ncbi:hypothetical protein BO99DRAFT_40414 [Aspergillus violaceofuscus CBS 115571]|uniref:Actin n=1 Tax=Aspergillus violaceofuscus (strain CBS 115571) TaxID=1450538 RepID=A0A2V5GXG9_ASPV1|nr:hypothetical protein BO99DRAFT_40414 [Aspergillus violaceofuscus CBS 115571]